MLSSATKKTWAEWMVDMRDKWKIFIMFLFGVLVGLFVDKEQLEYAIVEDNAVETIISIKQGDETTLLTLNRYEDGGGLWEVTYDGKNEPKTRRVE